jgi:hypothetical protein
MPTSHSSPAVWPPRSSSCGGAAGGRGRARRRRMRAVKSAARRHKRGRRSGGGGLSLSRQQAPRRGAPPPAPSSPRPPPMNAPWCPAPGSGPRSHSRAPPARGRPAAATAAAARGGQPGPSAGPRRARRPYALLRRPRAAPGSPHPVRRARLARALDGGHDAPQVALKVHRPLVEVACRERRDAAPHRARAPRARCAANGSSGGGRWRRRRGRPDRRLVRRERAPRCPCAGGAANGGGPRSFWVGAVITGETTSGNGMVVWQWGSEPFATEPTSR